jgi:hypothetical protein
VTPEDKDYINELRKADKAHFEAEIASVRRAVDVLSGTNDKRWEGANEFRNQLKDQAATFVTRQEFNQIKDQTGNFITREEFSQVKDSVSTFVTRSELWGAVGAAIAFIVALIQLIPKFLN